MGREVRRVPKDWKHPKDRGHYVPLLGGSFSTRLAAWIEGNEQWHAGYRENYGEGDKWIPRDADETATYADWDGDKPQVEHYMPEWTAEQATHFQMYENVTEGTPISPVFETPEELARWLADNGANAGAGMTATYEAWLRVCNGGYAPSMVFVGGQLLSGVEAC